ncbi:MAG: GNAT family N-acetyltransferase [Bdellovibrio sp.]|nr:GNAT family N-acetyltransferase [Bdellovibrio sp.]
MNLPKKLKAEIISAAETIDLRCRVLRPGQPKEICHYPEDDFATSFHLGIHNDHGQVICNGTFLQQPHEFFKNAINPYRLRGMASDPLFQKQGLGSIVIHHALTLLNEKKCDLLWFNARTTAEAFYAKFGFSPIGETFDIPLGGPHKVMYKWL